MNKLPTAKHIGHSQTAQSSQVNLLSGNVPLPNTSTPLPRIETKEPKTHESGKEPFGLNPKPTELYCSTPMDDLSPQLKQDKLDGTLLTREIAKSTKTKAEREARAHAKFGAPKEYRPPLGAAGATAPKLNNAMRGTIGQGLAASQYRMKHSAAMNRNGSKASLPPSQTEGKPEAEPYSAGLTKNLQRAQKRNSDLKKNH